QDWQTNRFAARAMSVQLPLGQAPTIGMQPATVVLVVPIATQAAHGLLTGRVFQGVGQSGILLVVAGADAGIEGRPAGRAGGQAVASAVEPQHEAAAELAPGPGQP